MAFVAVVYFSTAFNCAGFNPAHDNNIMGSKKQQPNFIW
jgi:hypothetical protein